MKKVALTVAMFLCITAGLFGQSPAGWKTTQDPTGSCQISFPPGWKLNMPPDGQATPPEGTKALVVVGSTSKLQPLTADWQKLLLVDHLFDNTSERVFYSGKPSNGKVTYILDLQGKNKRCKAQIEVNVNHSVDEVKAIMATVRQK
jgi:hypothetical protein